MSNKVIKTIGFNVTKQKDVEMLKHIAKKRNFSGYIKNLIAQDILQGKEPKTPETPNLGVAEAVKESKDPINKLEHFKTLLNQQKCRSNNQQQPPRSLT